MQALINYIKYIRIAYNWLTNLLRISKNKLTNIEDILVIIFKIEIDTKNFIAKLLNNKLKKLVKITSKILAK